MILSCRRLSVVLAVLCAVAVPMKAGINWVTNGPYAKSLRAVAISPQDTSVLYAGAFGWGVFKSTDAGASWISVRTGLTNGYVRSLLVLSNSTVFCGTNDGVFKTTNGGTTWTLSIATPFSVRGLAYDPASNRLVAATYGSGLYRSSDQGTSWGGVSVHDVGTGETLSHQWCVAFFGNDSLYVGGSILDIGSGGALFKSTNGGTNWTQVQPGIGIRSSVRSVAVSPSNPEMSLIIGTAAKGVYKSTNGGINWTEINGGTTSNPLPDPQINTVGFSSLYRYAGTDSLGGLYLRALGDTAFGWLAGSGLPGAAAQISAIAINPSEPGSLLLATEGKGAYRSTNAGVSWTPRTTGMMGTAPRVIRRNGNGQIFAGMEFGDGLWISSDQGLSWAPSAIGTSNAITSIGITSTPAVVYAGAYGSGVLRSSDGGATWGVTDTTVINHFVRTVSVHPTNASIVYAGTGNGVYGTTNGGTTWEAKNTGMPPGASIRSMALDPVNASILYAGTDSTFLYKTTDAGASWTHLSAANGFLPQDAFIRSITIDYANHATLYVGADSGRIYKSTNSGTNWMLHAQMPIVHSVRSILIHPNDHKVFFCATFGDGLFVSADSGAHWAPMNTGLADLEFYSLESDQATPLTLYAGSGMHGVYRGQYTYVNHPPVLASIGNKIVLAGSTLSFTAVASDSDGTIPVLSALGLPAGASFLDSATGHGVFAWTPTLAQLGDYSVTFTASDGTASDSEPITISVLDPASSTLVPVHFDAGWNIVSVPLTVPDYRKSVLFSTAVSSAFMYGGGYSVAETLSNGSGYWLKYGTAQDVTMGGGPLLHDTVAVRAGWNILGSVSETIPIASVVPLAPVTLTSSIYGFSAQSGYASADSIRPGMGYWVKASQAGAVVLNSAPVAEAAARILQSAPEGVRRDYFTFTDAAGNMRTIAVRAGGSYGEWSGDSELPPVPPGGVFDVRYVAGGCREAAFPGDAATARYSVALSNPGEAVTISWEIASSDRMYEFSLGGAVLSMQGSGSAALPVHRRQVTGDLTVRRLAPAESRQPRTAVLEQNFPNPFNPSTRIRFSLPEASVVSVKVFDLLGREVATLASGILAEGSYERLWDASAQGSGLYYCRLDAAELSRPEAVTHQVMKMFLIK